MLDGLAYGIMILSIMCVIQIIATLYFAICYFKTKYKYDKLLDANLCQQSDTSCKSTDIR